MSSIVIEIKQCYVREKGTFFLVAQLDETEYPDKQKVSQKFRTDIVGYNTQYLRFHKNMFKFEGLSLGNRLVIKFGCFKVKPSAEEAGVDLNDTNQLLVCLIILTVIEKLSAICLLILCNESAVRDLIEKAARDDQERGDPLRTPARRNLARHQCRCSGKFESRHLRGLWCGYQ
jgi:hypothetical protein